MLEIILIYLAIGAVAGTVAGLFGVGGGTIIVPSLIFAFGLQGFSGEVATHMAIGTSLATIVITSISSVLAHNKKGAVRWDLFWRFTPGLCIGVWIGAYTAAQLTGKTLMLAFGIFSVIIAIQMGFKLQAKGGRDVPGLAGLTASGGIIGWLSALFGIGGGSLTVPFLSWCRVSIHEAIGTAAAGGLPIAFVGALGYVYEGWQRSQLPEWSAGFVYLPAFFGIILMSTLFAKLGAYLAHNLPPDKLKQIFAIMLFLIGVSFIIKA